MSYNKVGYNKKCYGNLAQYRSKDIDLGKERDKRYRVIANLLLKGYSNKEIATEGHLNIRTVKNDIHNMCVKYKLELGGIIRVKLAAYLFTNRKRLCLSEYQPTESQGENGHRAINLSMSETNRTEVKSERLKDTSITDHFNSAN